MPLRGQAGQEKQSSSPVYWREEQQCSFEQLKTSLIEAPLLAYHRGLGAVLSQVQDEQERVITYANRGLNRTERNCNNYCTFKLELLALIWAVTEKFKDYLISSPFVIVTDNNPLAHLSTAKLGAMEQRWVSRLANVRYTIA